MSYFSPFWKTHYKKIGTCCITLPLQTETVPFTNGSRLVSYIDTGWMYDIKLKWIGWDKQGYYAWINPDGMIHRFNDLKRNERGKKYEKEVDKLEIAGDGSALPDSWPRGRALYEWECEVQEKCGFCPKDSGGSKKGKEDEEDTPDPTATEGGGGGGVEKEDKDEQDWRSFAGQDEEDKKQPGFDDPADDDDVTFTAHVTDDGKVKNEENDENDKTSDFSFENENNGKEEYDEDSYKRFLKMPEQEEQQQPQQPPKEEKPIKVNEPVIAKHKQNNPVLNTQKVLKNKVTHLPAVPWSQRKFQYIVQPDDQFDEGIAQQQKPVIDNVRIKKPFTLPFPTSRGIDERLLPRVPSPPKRLRQLGFLYPSISHQIGWPALEFGEVESVHVEWLDKKGQHINGVSFRLSDGLSYKSGLQFGGAIAGGKENAFRHAIWQGTIVAKFGEAIAKAFGDAHEPYPSLHLQFPNSEQLSFDKDYDQIQLADNWVDLKNNELVRAEMRKYNGRKTAKAIAHHMLRYFKEQGFWVIVEGKDGILRLKRIKISAEEYSLINAELKNKKDDI